MGMHDVSGRAKAIMVDLRRVADELPPATPTAGAPVAGRSVERGARYSDRSASPMARFAGATMTGAVCLSILAILLFRWGQAPATIVPADLAVFEISEHAAPPEPASEIPPGPEQVEHVPRPAVEAPAVPAPPLPLPSLSARTVLAEKTLPDSGPPVERTTAPEARPVSVAASASDARPSWEGRVLAALNKAKRYPREALRNGQQGTPWIRFIMDRAGKVRSVRLERSSGFDALDREALALAKRAEPLPPPPDSVPGERIELVLPVEFFKG